MSVVSHQFNIFFLDRFLQTGEKDRSSKEGQIFLTFQISKRIILLLNSLAASYHMFCPLLFLRQKSVANFLEKHLSVIFRNMINMVSVFSQYSLRWSTLTVSKGYLWQISWRGSTFSTFKTLLWQIFKEERGILGNLGKKKLSTCNSLILTSIFFKGQFFNYQEKLTAHTLWRMKSI